jgi:hypothetical protein
MTPKQNKPMNKNQPEPPDNAGTAEPNPETTSEQAESGTVLALLKADPKTGKPSAEDVELFMKELFSPKKSD